MRTYFPLLLTLCLFAMGSGCGNSSSTPTDTASSQAGGSSEGTISQVAQAFLEAVRTGNSANAASQLTPLAQERMRAADMDFELLANNSAKYQVGRVEIIEADEALVESLWIESDSSGQPQQEQWTLALQRIEGKWSVLGIVAETGSGQPPVVMDFENPSQLAEPANTATAAAPANTAPANTVPRQATRPAAQDPFRQ